jgi:hypothetical protein
MSDWVDWQQNRRIKQLQNEVSAAYSYASSQTRTLQAKLSQVQGTLETRLNRLATAFDAFVELSDLRLELAVYVRETATRHHARRLVAALGPAPAAATADPDASDTPDGFVGRTTGIVPDGASVPPVELEDAPGYWLTPATEALSVLARSNGAGGGGAMTGAMTGAEPAIAAATGRDPARTALFLTLTLTHAGLPQPAVRWLDEAFPPLGAATTRVQRTLWLACADGVYGAPGRALLTRRLAEFLADPAIEEASDRGRWADLVRAVAAAPARVPSELSGIAELTEPLNAAGRLAALRTSIEKGLVPDASAVPPPDIGDLIGALIEEGAPEELPLLGRARELRQLIETGVATTGRGWQDEAGSTSELLRSDAFGARPGPREVALRAGARRLTEAADDLAAYAAVRPPDEVTIKIGGTPIRVRRSGPASLAAAEEDIEQDAAAERAAGAGGSWGRRRGRGPRRPRRGGVGRNDRARRPRDHRRRGDLVHQAARPARVGRLGRRGEGAGARAGQERGAGLGRSPRRAGACRRCRGGGPRRRPGPARLTDRPCSPDGPALLAGRTAAPGYWIYPSTSPVGRAVAAPGSSPAARRARR